MLGLWEMRNFLSTPISIFLFLIYVSFKLLPLKLNTFHELFFIIITIGPYATNGVPLRRVNQRYVIATSTKIGLDGVNVGQIDDAFFARDKKSKKANKESDFLAAGEKKANVIDDARLKAQKTVDDAVSKNIAKVENLAAYLKAEFSLSKADKPHLLKF